MDGFEPPSLGAPRELAPGVIFRPWEPQPGWAATRYQTTGMTGVAWSATTGASVNAWVSNGWTNTSTTSLTQTWLDEARAQAQTPWWVVGPAPRVGRHVHPPTARRYSLEERLAMMERSVARQREVQAQHVQRVAMVDAANRRARDLLVSCLNDRQRAMFEACTYFMVGTNLGHVFKVTEARVHGLFRLDIETMQPIEEWCVTPNGEIPVYDVMLAQKLALETDEEGLRREANVWALPSRLMLHRAEAQWHAGQADYLQEAVA